MTVGAQFQKPKSWSSKWLSFLFWPLLLLLYQVGNVWMREWVWVCACVRACAYTSASVSLSHSLGQAVSLFVLKQPWAAGSWVCVFLSVWLCVRSCVCVCVWVRACMCVRTPLPLFLCLTHSVSLSLFSSWSNLEQLAGPWNPDTNHLSFSVSSSRFSCVVLLQLIQISQGTDSYFYKAVTLVITKQKHWALRPHSCFFLCRQACFPRITCRLIWPWSNKARYMATSKVSSRHREKEKKHGFMRQWWNHRACFKGASLFQTCFKGASLPQTCFKGASQLKTCFNGASLPETCFKRASLLKTCFKRASLLKTYFKGTSLLKACFKGANLLKMGFVLEGPAFLHQVVKSFYFQCRILLASVVVSLMALPWPLRSCLSWNMSMQNLCLMSRKQCVEHGRAKTGVIFVCSHTVLLSITVETKLRNWTKNQISLFKVSLDLSLKCVSVFYQLEEACFEEASSFNPCLDAIGRVILVWFSDAVQLPAWIPASLKFLQATFMQHCSQKQHSGASITVSLDCSWQEKLHRKCEVVGSGRDGHWCGRNVREYLADFERNLKTKIVIFIIFMKRRLISAYYFILFF